MDFLRQNGPDLKLAQDAEQTISRLSREINQSSVNIDHLTLGQAKALHDSAQTMDAAQLEKWAVELPRKSVEERQAAAIIFTNDALEHNRGNQKQVLAAALQADSTLTLKISEDRLANMHEELSNTSGDIAGIIGTMLLKKGTERVLESAANFLAVSPMMKTALSLGCGLAFGGIANNYAAGRDILDQQGLYRNSALSGLLFLGSVAAGPVIFPAATGNVWQRAERAYIFSNVGLANYSIINQLGLRNRAENFETSLAAAKWLDRWRLQTDYLSH